MKVTAVYEPAKEGGYTCFVQEIPAAISQGETLDEARANLLDALKLVLERIALERYLRGQGCLLYREGGGHSIWLNPSQLPRHREIKEGTVRAICKQLEIPHQSYHNTPTANRYPFCSYSSAVKDLLALVDQHPETWRQPHDIVRRFQVSVFGSLDHRPWLLCSPTDAHRIRRGTFRRAQPLYENRSSGATILNPGT